MAAEEEGPGGTSPVVPPDSAVNSWPGPRCLTGCVAFDPCREPDVMSAAPDSFGGAMPLVEFCDFCNKDASLECRDCGTRFCCEHSTDHDQEHAAWERECHECGFDPCECDSDVFEVAEPLNGSGDWTRPERWGI